MRPVNLLPEGQRPRGAGDNTGNGPKIAIGVLAALLVMVAGYVFTVNQVNSRETEIAETQAAADKAQARAAALAPYAELAAIKQSRTASVTELAGGRFDWERLMREIAMVLPNGTWLQTVTAGLGPQDGSGSPPEPGATEADATPTVKLEGCAPSQPAVATLLVRLRKLNGVTDVQLGESRRDDADGGTGSGSVSEPASGTSCGDNFTFNATVTFETPLATAVGSNVDRVPASLGGGQ
jgi:Tfp pilus assembly protein PilN